MKTITGNIIEGDESIYCRKLKGIIDWSKTVLKTENRYGQGTINEALNEMKRNRKKIIKKMESDILKIDKALKKESEKNKLF